MTVFEKIKEQQAECKGRPAWYVGEQLADICRNDPHAAEIVEQDLTVPEMSIQAAEEKIAVFAKENGGRSFGFCSGADAERILREFYGIGSAPAPDTFDLADYL